MEKLRYEIVFTDKTGKTHKRQVSTVNIGHIARLLVGMNFVLHSIRRVHGS